MGVAIYRTIEVIHMERNAQYQYYTRHVVGNTGNETGVGSPFGLAVDPINA